MSRPTKEESQQCPQGIRLLCLCDARNGHDCNADLGIVWTAGRTGEVPVSYTHLRAHET